MTVRMYNFLVQDVESLWSTGAVKVDAVRVFEDLASVGLSFPDLIPPRMEPRFRENPAALADVLSYFHPSSIVLVALPQSACLLAYGGARSLQAPQSTPF